MDLLVRSEGGPQSVDPRRQRTGRVSAAQPEIRDRAELDEWRARPLLLVSDNQRRSVRFEPAEEVVVEPRVMPELRRGRSSKRGQKPVKQGQVDLARGRKLQQDRAEPIAQRTEALADQRREPDAIEGFTGVRESPVGFHAEAEISWRAFSPFEQRGLRRRAIEASVQLDPMQALGVVSQHPGAGQAGRVEDPFPGRVAETRRAAVKTGYDAATAVRLV